MPDDQKLMRVGLDPRFDRLRPLRHIGAGRDAVQYVLVPGNHFGTLGKPLPDVIVVPEAKPRLPRISSRDGSVVLLEAGARIRWEYPSDIPFEGFRITRSLWFQDWEGEGHAPEEAVHEGLLPPETREFLDTEYHQLEHGKRYVYWLRSVSGDYRRYGFVTLYWRVPGDIPAVGEFEPGKLRWQLREDDL